LHALAFGKPLHFSIEVWSLPVFVMDDSAVEVAVLVGVLATLRNEVL
jgi:hypothetical protein